MPTYPSNEAANSTKPKADYRAYIAEIPDGADPKTISVDFSAKPVAWLYRSAKGGIYGTLRIPDGKSYKIFLSPPKEAAVESQELPF